jgi:hypothetical protein
VEVGQTSQTHYSILMYWAEKELGAVVGDGSLDFGKPGLGPHLFIVLYRTILE